MLPDLLVDCEFHPLAGVLVEALEIPPIDIDPLPVCRPQQQKRFNLTSNVLPLHDLFRLFLPIFEIRIHICPNDIIRRVQKEILLPYLTILLGLENILLEDEDL